MSGLCSKHQRVNDPGCRLCQLHPRDVFPDWDRKEAEAIAAGKETCSACGFVYYLTVDACPFCDAPSAGPKR